MHVPDPASQNQLLASLPFPDYQRLHPHLEQVSLSLGQVLHEAGEPIAYVYFPLDALVSLISAVDHSMTEFGLVGNEGMVGVSVLLGGSSTISRAIVQMADAALRIDARTLKAEFERGGILQKQLLLYLQLLLTQISQNTACQIHHQTKPRLARWLLSIQDRLHQNNLTLTQRCIADSLGTRRATITEAARHFQKQGIIRYKRGEITILNRSALEQMACSCYQRLHCEQERLRTISQTIR